MAQASISRFDKLAKELVLNNKSKDANGKIILKNVKWTPHRIKTLLICSECCIVEYYDRKADMLDFRNCYDDDSTKSAASVMYSLGTSMSAHFTNVREIVAVCDQNFPLIRVLAGNEFQTLSAAFKGVNLVVAQAPSTCDSLVQLHNKLREACKARALALCESVGGYDFNLGFSSSNRWELCTGVKKADGTPPDFSFKDGYYTFLKDTSRRKLADELPRIISYADVAHDIGGLRVYNLHTATYKTQAFDINSSNYPEDENLIKYMNKHYFCLYKVLEILTTRSKQDVGALSKGTDKLLQASLSLGELCRSSFPKVGSIFLDGALHYIEGEIETESTRDDFRANLAWVLSKACDGGVYKSWQATLKLPNVTKSCTDETRKTFAVQSFARCTLIVAMTIEALKVWGKYDVDNGIPDEFYCQMRCALLKATKVSVADNLTEKVLYLLQVYSIPTAYAEALIRGLRGVLWSVESSVDITVEMLEKHEALLKEVLNNG